MATDDRQVLVTGQAPVPAGFLIPGNGQIKPKAMNAVFDGTNAAGNFTPALEIISDAGIVVARVAAATVTAGNSAEVTWAPFLREEQAATGGGGSAYAHGSYDSGRDPHFGVTAGTNDNCPFPVVSVTDSSVFTWSTVVHTNDTLTLHPVGTYLIYFGLQRSGGGSNAGGLIYSPEPEEFPHQYFGYAANPPVLPVGGGPTDGDYAVLHATASDYSVTVLLENPSGFNMSIFIAGLSVIYLATGV